MQDMDIFIKNLRILKRAVPETPAKINRLELIRVKRLIRKFLKNEKLFTENKKTDPVFRRLKMYHYRIMEELQAVQAELERHSDSVLDRDFYNAASSLYQRVSSIL